MGAAGSLTLAIKAGFVKVAAVFGVLVLAGCAGVDEPVRPCCYVGDVQLARLGDVSYQLESGETRAFTDVFPEFAPGGGGFGRALPFQSAPIRLVTYDALEAALPAYDANRNHQLESQELVVLYLVELARGVGIAATGVGAGEPAGALALAASDVQGLIDLVRARQPSVAPAQAAIFRELVKLGNDIRGRTSPFDNTDSTRIWLPR